MIERETPELPEWLARELPFEHGFVRVGGGRMHFMEVGRGRPVLLLHGNPTWGFLWRKVAMALDPRRFRVIMPDLIGLGLSDKPRALGAHTLEAHARWVGELFDALELEDVILGVQDWGGPIGLLAASQREARVAGLVIGNTVVSEPRPGFRPTAFHHFSRQPIVSDLAFRLFGFPQIALSSAQGDRGSISGDIARAYRWPLRRLRDRAAPLALARMVPDGLEHPTVPALREVGAYYRRAKVPIRIVWGMKDPVLGRAIRRVRELRPDVPVRETAAGHFLQEEVPAALAAALVEVDREAR